MLNNITTHVIEIFLLRCKLPPIITAIIKAMYIINTKMVNNIPKFIPELLISINNEITPIVFSEL